MDIFRKNIDNIIANLKEESFNLCRDIFKVYHANPNSFLESKKEKLIVNELTILWLTKNKEKINNPSNFKLSLEQFSKILNNKEYKIAAMMSEIAFNTNKLQYCSINDEHTLHKLNNLLKIDKNSLYLSKKMLENLTNNQELFNKKMKQISKEAATDASKIITNLVKDKQFSELCFQSNYRISSDYFEYTNYFNKNIQDDLNLSLKVLNNLNKIFINLEKNYD